MLHKKRIAALLAAVSLLALVGCGDSQDSTAEESSTESIETTVLETEPTTEATTTVVTTTESNIKSVPVYEENENITSILKKAYTLNGQDPPESDILPHLKRWGLPFAQCEQSVPVRAVQ